MTTETRTRNRVTPDGRRIGEQLSRMTDIEVGKLIAEGEWLKDERCKSCAFRYGTVPNGCLQTQADALKSVLERKTFGCHVPGHGTGTCMGWFAAMQLKGGAKRKPITCPWEFSPPDEP